MMRSLFSSLIVLFFLVGCATEKLPVLPDLSDTAAGGDVKQACAAVFPIGKWQFVHAIDFTMKDGNGTAVVGITTIDGLEMASALVTVEGLTLFSAKFHQDNSIEILRAVPPFDGPAFARGLMHDIRAIFQPPGKKMQRGRLAGSDAVCRYRAADGGVVDVLPNVNDCWQIKRYTADLLLQRSVAGRSCRKIGLFSIPDRLELKAYGPAGYTLKMKLISAENTE